MPKIGGAGGGGTTLASSTLNLGNVTGNVTLDVSAAAVFVATITGATTFTFVNWPPGAVAPEPTVIARQDNVGHTISFAGITWLPVGTSPVFQVGAGQTNVTTFFSTDNGTTIYGQGGSLSGGGYGVYGDGSDGVVTLDGTAAPAGMGLGGTTYWLTRDFFADTLTIADGYTLEMGQSGRPYRLRVKNTLTIAPTVFINGAAAAATTGATGGKNGTGGSLLAGGNGADGVTGAGVTAANIATMLTGSGGRGGHPSGATTGGGGAGLGQEPATGAPRALPELAMMANTPPTGFVAVGGGAGGGSGGGDGTNAGGGGGRGGNPVWIAARNIVNNGTIRSRGGTGNPSTGGNAGGGGGGQGGPVVYIYSTYSGSGTVQSSGGAAGAGTGTGGAGLAGSVNRVIGLAN
jgi:hypothetical protein